MCSKTSYTQMEQTKVYIICKNRSGRLSDLKELNVPTILLVFPPYPPWEGTVGKLVNAITYDCCRPSIVHVSL